LVPSDLLAGLSAHLPTKKTIGRPPDTTTPQDRSGSVIAMATVPMVAKSRLTSTAGRHRTVPSSMTYAPAGRSHRSRRPDGGRAG